MTATNLSSLRRSGGGAIIDVLEEILSKAPNAAGLSIHWQSFGSNGETKADYSRGVLERFTRRAPCDCEINRFVKTISDPRRINYMYNAHLANYFEHYYAVDETGKPVTDNLFAIVADKIAINHYFTKSFEEYAEKVTRGKADLFEKRNLDEFARRDYNEEFDDGILKYQSVRAENFSLESWLDRFNRVTTVLTEILSEYKSGKIFSLETALTCRALSGYLRRKFPSDAELWKICEGASLIAISKSLKSISLAEMGLLILELPNLLSLPYSSARDLRRTLLQFIPQFMNDLRDFIGRTKYFHLYKNYIELDYIREFLKLESDKLC